MYSFDTRADGLISLFDFFDTHHNTLGRINATPIAVNAASNILTEPLDDSLPQQIL